MYTPLKNISLKNLCNQPVMFDANIFMVGIENRNTDSHYSFSNMKDIYLIPLFESFSQIYIHKMVYDELDDETKSLVDEYINNKGNVSIVDEPQDYYGSDPQYTTIFNDIANHIRVQYIRGNSKDRGEVYSLAYAAYYDLNFFCSKEIMVDVIAEDITVLNNINIITFDVIVLLAYVFHNSKGNTEYNKALKSIYKRYCEDVIRRHNLPTTLSDYVISSIDYID